MNKSKMRDCNFVPFSLEKRFKNENKIYFVAETKSAGQELRGSEKMKIKCGKEHFKEFKDIVYKRVASVSELSK